jgi:hypothetical protein
MFDDDIDRLFEQLDTQWNIAERRIKKAEQVRGGEVVSSAIFELRYAGRKLIDALELLRTKNWNDNKVEYDKIRRFLHDAIEDCVKAKHDAIDSMLRSKIELPTLANIALNLVMGPGTTFMIRLKKRTTMKSSTCMTQ